jgi:TolB protein
VIAKRATHGSTPAARASLVSRLALMQPDGSFAAISPGPMDGDPSCSSDGASVVYARSFARADSEIWLHSFDSGQSERALAPGREPAFSPDGQWIAYSRSETAPPTLWRVRRDGSGRSRLGWGSGSAEYGPAFSPDGAIVVYESLAGDRHRLFLRRFDGTGDSVLLSDGDGTHAVW